VFVYAHGENFGGGGGGGGGAKIVMRHLEWWNQWIYVGTENFEFLDSLERYFTYFRTRFVTTTKSHF
jgi:hypothetical protein